MYNIASIPPFSVVFFGGHALNHGVVHVLNCLGTMGPMGAWLNWLNPQDFPSWKLPKRALDGLFHGKSHSNSWMSGRITGKLPCHNVGFPYEIHLNFQLGNIIWFISWQIPPMATLMDWKPSYDDR